MVLYSSAQGRRIGFLLAQEQYRCVAPEKMGDFCRCLAQTDQKRTSSVQRDKL